MGNALASASSRLVMAAIVAYTLGMVAFLLLHAFHRSWFRGLAKLMAWAGVAAQVAGAVGRGVAAERVPWGNMYEYSTLLAVVIVVVYLLLVEPRPDAAPWFGSVVLAFASITLVIAASGLYVDPGPLVPALNSYWLKIHVVAAIVSSGFLTVGGLLSGVYLWQVRRERRSEDAVPPPIMGGAIGTTREEDEVGVVVEGYAGSAEEPQPAPRSPKSTRPSVWIDQLAYRVISFGFPLWTFAVIAGAVWAQEAWGRYWGWDPKEVWSFITWVLFAAYLHARATSGWRGSRAAGVAGLGFAALMINYYAVNLWIAGLHSYKGF